MLNKLAPHVKVDRKNGLTTQNLRFADHRFSTHTRTRREPRRGYVPPSRRTRRYRQIIQTSS
jgi:hypothetical protein